MSETSRNTSCEQRVDSELQDRLADLRPLWAGHCAGKYDQSNRLAEYGLSFDYVDPDTFDDQREAYFRYQLSWGGPSDEFRFFVNPDLSCHRIEYWFLDWFDGAHRILSGADEALMDELYHCFRETCDGSPARTE